MDMKRKSFTGLKITNEAQGEVEAVFATLGVKDHDGDVTLKGAFKNGEEVRISAYNHESWKGALPVGKGTIEEVGDNVVLKGKFFMDTTGGKDTFNTVKNMGGLQEWSYGYDTLDQEPGTKDGEHVNLIKKQKVHEVSPVILGAGLGTHTTMIKSLKQLDSELHQGLRDAGKERWGGTNNYVYVEDFDLDASWAIFCISSETSDPTRYIRIGYVRETDGSVTLSGDETEVERETSFVPTKSAEEAETKTSPEEKGMKFQEHAEKVIAEVGELTERTSSVVALRAEKGKENPLSESAEPMIKELSSHLETLVKHLEECNANDTSSEDAELETIFLSLTAQKLGDN